MPVLLKNAVFDTQRSVFNATTHVTAAPTTNLQNQVGRIAQMNMTDYAVLPEGALKSVFTLNVEMSTDIQIHDLIVNIRLSDGITPWFATSSNESWKVLFIHPTPPGMLANKRCYIGRYTGGGVVNT